MPIPAQRPYPTLEPRLKLWVENKGKAVLGDFRVELLRAVGQTGTLADAAQRMGISYRRAWGMIREMERNLGTPLVLSQKGGSDYGGSQLTPTAEALIERYQRFRKLMERDLGKEFKEGFCA